MASPDNTQRTADPVGSGEGEMAAPVTYDLGVTREVRIAVVMYGGVSLAIYINGIAQELLRLVRSTASNYEAGKGSGRVTATERVYQKLSFLLADKEKSLANAEANMANPQASPPTRFVIDILSGTSAGGINGIFLAKALANGQDLEDLKELWVREGDIETLLNDKISHEDPLVLQDPPVSLLNGRRLYLELLKAFDLMEKNPNKVTRSPYVDEVDLYVTSTDLQGVVLPIQLSDALVYERRHRNVLHFVYSKAEVSGAPQDRNDFDCEYNPFLAYAARCTSSFPFAFEPMLLTDIDDVLEGLPGYRGKVHCRSDSKNWLPFFKAYQDPRNFSTVPFPKRSFGDGGYLDNKPFSFAIDALASRQADVPVIRKLIYVEPSPEHPEDVLETDRRPDFLSNVAAALFTLPQYETIREDLQRVLDRNRLVERINRVVKGVDRDVEMAHRDQSGQPAKEQLTDEDWAKFDLADMVTLKGRSYLAYHRLEIAAVTDAIATLVARVTGLDEESGYFLVLRSLLRAWRMKAYVEYQNRDGQSQDADQAPTMNTFLHCFNLGYPMRRINFLRSKIDQLYRLDGSAREILDLRIKGFWPSNAEFPLDKTQFRNELKAIKSELNRVQRALRHAGRTLRSRTKADDAAAQSGVTANPLYDQIKELIGYINQVAVWSNPDDPANAVLNSFLQPKKTTDPNADEQTTRIEEICDQRAVEFLNQYPGVWVSINNTAQSLQAQLLPERDEADRACRVLLENAGQNSGTPTAPDVARLCLNHYYDHYDDYDMITFPLLYETGVGEAEIVDVTRVSPEDAKALIDERSLGCRKLAGTSLAHFGAFLASSWRKNDIFWGRLDGAERIISSLLPHDPEVAAQLIGDAQAAIVCDTLGPLGPTERKDLLVESLMRTKSGKEEADKLTGLLNKLKTNTSDPELRNMLAELIDENEVRQHYLDIFAERSKLAPEQTLRSAARATTIVGKMFSAVSADYEAGSKYVAWIARLGQIFWALVEVAVPRSLPNLIFRYWVKLLYLFEVLLIVGATLLGEKPTQKFALTAFGLTAGVHCAVAILGDIMQSRNRWLNLIKAVVISLLVGAVVLGGVSAAGIFGANGIWKALNTAHDTIETAGAGGFWLRIGIVLFFLAFLGWAVRDDLAALWRGKGKS